jgi:hypothetical protein
MFLDRIVEGLGAGVQDTNTKEVENTPLDQGSRLQG